MSKAASRLMPILFMSLLSPAAHVDAQGYVTGWDPEALRVTLVRGDLTHVSLTFAYDNGSNDTVEYLIYIQDNPACPTPPSSHSWISFKPTSGLMPANQTGVAAASILMDGTGLAYGTYTTNMCFVANDAENPTNVAVPVTLKSVAEDDIFMDEFE